MKKLLLLFAVLLASQYSNSQLYLSEILLSPPGDDSPFEYIEIRGTSNAIIADGTYIVGIDGDGDDSNSPGDVESDMIDLSGLQLGSNGFLVIMTTGHDYTVDPNATVALDLTDGNLEDQTHTYLLIQTDTPPTTSDDIDSNDDGTPDGAVYDGWNVLDGIAFADDDGTLPHDEFVYADVVFAEAAIVTTGTLKYPSTATIVQTSTQFDYAARIRNSTGSALTDDETTSDWFGGDVPSNTSSPRVWTLSSTSGKSYPSYFGGQAMDHIGSENPSGTPTGIENAITSGQFKIYPNPATDVLNIESNSVDVSKIEILSLTGKTVFSQKAYNEKSIDVSGLTKGIYILQISSDSEQFSSKIVIK